MSELIGLPEPPELGAAALPDGTFDGRAVFITGAGTGLGKAIAGEFARLGADIVIASRKPEHLDAGREAIEAIGGKVLTVACDIRDPDAITAAFDAATDAFGLPSVLVNNAAANFPATAEDLSPNAWRTVVDITLNGTFFCSREFARRHLAESTPGIDHQRRGVLRLDRRARLCPLGRSQGRRQEHGGDPGRRMGPLRDPGQWAGSRAVSARGHDRRHPEQPDAARTTRIPASRR